MPSSSFLSDLEKWVQTTPDAVALATGDRVVRYAELDRLVDAAGPSAATPEPGRPVCVPARKSPESIALVIACLRAGRRVLLPSAELGATGLAELAAREGCAQVLTPDGATPVATAVTGRLAPAGPGLLLTTSGSTGTPKVVELNPDGVERFLAWGRQHFGLGPGTAVLNHAPLNFDLCLLDVWATLAAGGRVELIDPDQAANAAYLAALCAGRMPAVIQAVPLFYRLLADGTAAGTAFDGVRHVVSTGDTLPLPLLGQLPALFPRARLWNLYGCTETNDSFLHEIDVAAAEAGGAVPIGRPIRGVRAQVVDEAGAVVTGAGQGELLVRTPFQAVGYTDRRRTGERWRDGWYRTGDQVRRDASGLHFLAGRNESHVKVRGVRTNVQEVERILLDHADVVEAAVLALPDDLAGTSLHAVVRRRAASDLDSIRLRVHCADRLPRTSIPAVVHIVEEALPRTSTGKVDREMLARDQEEQRHADSQ